MNNLWCQHPGSPCPRLNLTLRVCCFQVEALKKQAESSNRLVEELTGDCEGERAEFEKERKSFQVQVDEAKMAAREQFAQKVEELV